MTYETGENQLNFDVLIKMADLFGVSTDFLLGSDNGNSFKQSYSDQVNLLNELNNHLKDLGVDAHNTFGKDSIT